MSSYQFILNCLRIFSPLMVDIVRVSSAHDVRAEFLRRGISVSEWARDRGLSAHLTYQILAGRRIGLRGQSHKIAVLLGLKPGVADSGMGVTFVCEPQATTPTPTLLIGPQEANPA
jgi:gp16 family phage-associated protein